MIERAKRAWFLLFGVAFFLSLGATACDEMSKNQEATAKCPNKKTFASVECLECCIENGATNTNKGSAACVCNGHGNGHHTKQP